MMEPENPLLYEYVLSLTGREQPRVCFLPTATGDSDSVLVRFYEAFPVSRALAATSGSRRPRQQRYHLLPRS
jgi:peptidase E